MDVCVLFLEDDTVRERGPAQADDSNKTTGIDLFTYMLNIHKVSTLHYKMISWIITCISLRTRLEANVSLNFFNFLFKNSVLLCYVEDSSQGARPKSTNTQQDKGSGAGNCSYNFIKCNMVVM